MKKIVSFWIVFLLAIVSAEAGKQTRIKYYLTRNTFTGSQALTACAEGYHMASLLEIFDVSNFKYDTSLGFTRDDSGFGPPTESGWIRTGKSSEGQTGIDGVDSCFAWTSDDASHLGTTVILAPFEWDNAPLATIDPWDSNIAGCSFSLRVWCVQD
jgi:hypothetical protein